MGQPVQLVVDRWRPTSYKECHRLVELPAADLTEDNHQTGEARRSPCHGPEAPMKGFELKIRLLSSGVPG